MSAAARKRGACLRKMATKQWKTIQCFFQSKDRAAVFRTRWPSSTESYLLAIRLPMPSMAIQWTYAGQPFDYDNGGLQLYCFAAHQGKLCVGSWPEGKVAVYQGGEDWQEIGRVGEDGTEVNGLVVYNGKLYGGSLPRAEVCRYDGDSKWTSLKRFYSPEGWKPGIPYIAIARK